MEAFEIRHLTFQYPLREEPALRDVSLTVQKGAFVTLCGKSGCGKTTLLRHLKPVLTPHGTRSGEILLGGVPVGELSPRGQASRIGYVQQSPEHQIVTDKVWHELAFGLESLGCDTQAIRLRTAEMASFFGIESWFYSDVAELSGGQKQLLNLASVMAMQPELLILDEPTSQLDPIAASEFLAAVQKINRELGTTVLLSEQRLEEALPMSDRVLVMDCGTIILDETPLEAGAKLKETGHGMFLAMPAPMRIYAGVGGGLPCPVTVRDGRRWLQEMGFVPEAAVEETKPEATIAEEVLRWEEVWFRYEKNTPDVLKGLSLSARKGELLAIVGGNGTGKTTALNTASGLLKPYRGRVLLGGTDVAKAGAGELFRGNLSVLPQNPESLFVKKTVELDLMEMLDPALDETERRARAREAAERTEIAHLLAMHPYDLSGGEQQRAALAKILLTQPKVLLLDEPTKGLDGFFKRTFAVMLRRLCAEGVAVVMVSHDIEFCAQYADRCAYFFDGMVISGGTPRAFFSGNSFYTTAANRMARDCFPGAVTTEDVIGACRKQRGMDV